MQNNNSCIRLSKEKLQSIRQRTPVFVFNKEALLANYSLYQQSFPTHTEICYAVKANSENIVLKTLHEAGASFEVASKYELSMLKRIKIPAHQIIYGTSVKQESHLKEFVDYGIDRFAFDSEHELLKIAKYAPQARVYVRALVNDASDSVFTLSEKFGVCISEAVELLVKAKKLGLVPYGISFSVGSQARNEKAWANGIEDLITAIQQLSELGIEIQVINLGGGYPQSYQNHDGFPTISTITDHIKLAIQKLPYNVKYIIEPGRGLVANTFTLLTSVIAKSKRQGRHWLYIDAGVYNAVMEALTCQGSTTYQIESLAMNGSSHGKELFVLSGPTGDGLDIIHRETILPSNIQVGDKLIIYDTGAYTTTLATTFNGFPKPKIITI